MIGLAFIWVRILAALYEQPFFSIDSGDAKDTSQEFLSSSPYWWPKPG